MSSRIIPVKYAGLLLGLLCAGALTAPAAENPGAALTVPVPASRLFPKIAVPATALVVVDLAKDTIAGQVAACGLQGIVNRTSPEKIYVLNTSCVDNRGGWDNPPAAGKQVQMGRVWLREIFSALPARELQTDPRQENPGFLALVADYKSYIKGLIIYDPALEEATIEAATTIAGQTDGIIVSPGLAKQLKAFGFPVIQDLRGKFKNNMACLDWLKANYFATANHQVAFTWSHMTTDKKTSWGGANKDYVVANRLFTFFLNIQNDTERKYYTNIINEYSPGTPILGWTDELKADRMFAEMGYFMVAMIAVENLTVMSSFPSVTGRQPAPVALPVHSNDTFVACFVPDGDNLEHSLVYEPHTILRSTNFDAVPATWIINPIIPDLAPPIFQWWQRHLGSQEFGAMLGDGSPGTDRFTGYAFYCDLLRHYLDQTGIRSMKQMVDAEAVSFRVQPYFINSGYAGDDWRGVGPYEYHMDNGSFHIGTVNIRDQDVNRALAAAPANQPLFLSIFCGTGSRDVSTAIKLLETKLKSRNDGRNYHFLRSMDLAATYRQWLGLPVQ